MWRARCDRRLLGRSTGPPLGCHPLLPFSTSKGGREVLTLVVLVILAVLVGGGAGAAAAAIPLTAASADSIGDFNYRLDVLGRTNGARSRCSRRRRATRRCSRVASTRRMRRRPTRVATCSPRRRRVRRSRRGRRRAAVAADRSPMRAGRLHRLVARLGVQLRRRTSASSRSSACGRGRVRCRPSAREGALLRPQRRTPELAFRRTASS